jgi:hypothetical protein
MTASPILSVHVPSQSLFDFHDNFESNVFNFTSCDLAGNSTSLFGWSDIPCLDENEMSFRSDKFYQKDEYNMSSYRDFASMDDAIPVLSTLVNSAQSNMKQSHCYYSFDVIKCTKPLHERSGSSIDCTPDTLPKKKLRTKPTSVKFSDVVSVREYSIVAGIHPCCVDGLAIELGWDFTEKSVSVKSDLIEKQSVTTRRKRLSSINCLRLTYFERRERLQRMTGKSELQMLRELHSL